MCKVRLADIVTCSETAWRRGSGSPIAQKHLDFVLCDVHSTRFLAAIELDDRSHHRPDRRKRDRFVNRVLAEAGIDLIRFRARSRYCAIAIRQRVLTAVSVDARKSASLGRHRASPMSGAYGIAAPRTQDRSGR